MLGIQTVDWGIVGTDESTEPPPPPQEFFFHLIDQLMPQIYENFSYKFFRLETVPENWCSASSSSSDEDSDSDERDSGTRREFRELRR